MKNVRILCSLCIGVEATLVDIETHIVRGLNSFSIIGLGDKSVYESKDRVSASLNSVGYKSPKQRNQKTIISLSPAHIKKEGSSYDLGIAISYLLGTMEIVPNNTDSHKIISIYCIGELGLDGQIKSTKGVLTGLFEAEEKNILYAIIPKGSCPKHLFPEKIHIFEVTHLSEAIALVKKFLSDADAVSGSFDEGISEEIYDDTTLREDCRWGEIKGNTRAKMALVSSIAGRHSIAMYGPPGVGKSLLASNARFLCPTPSVYDQRKIYSIYGSIGEDPPQRDVPYRRPDRGISERGLIGGGGNNFSPGEITLAHLGILHIDEILECHRNVIESLRDPLQNKNITISRSIGRIVYPSDFILVSTMNPCPCGRGDIKCTCSERDKVRYRSKMSSAIKDRIPIWIKVGSRDENDHVPNSHQKWIDKIDDVIYIRNQIKMARQILQKGVAISSDLLRKIGIACISKKFSDRLRESIISLAKTECALGGRDVVREEDVNTAFNYQVDRF